jgi:hypothetical protein
MNKKDFDLKLWGYIQSESTFFDLPIDKVTQLLERDISIDARIVKLKSLFPKITEDDLENEYEELTELEGSESRIYFGKDDLYIYKLTNPKYKSYIDDLFYDRFNEVLMYYILQDYLFPDCKYDNLKIYKDKMFVRQIFIEFEEPSRIFISRL